MNEREIRSVYSMSESNGWNYVEEFIVTNIQSRQKELVNNDFDDLVEVKELQAEIKCLQKVLRFVDTRKQKYLNKGDN